MKRRIGKINSVIKIKVTGKNIHNFVRRMVSNQIQVINMDVVSYREVYVVLRYFEYVKLLKVKTIYDIQIVSVYGFLRLRQVLKKNIILLSMLILGLGLVLFLSHLIFDIQVIHSNKEIRDLLYRELMDHGIRKYSFKKGYLELETIEDQILEDNKDSLEWIEIIITGTRCVVRVEERIINEKKEEVGYQNVVASKNAILTEIDAFSGEKVKKINDYVRKGETVISGNLSLPDGSFLSVSAKGKIYGEVWYTVSIEYPYVYYEERKTGRKKNVFVLEFLGKRFEFLNFKPFFHFSSDSQVLLSNNFLPVSFNFERQEEVMVIESIYTEDEALTKAIEIAKRKLLDSNSKILEVKDFKILVQSTREDTIYLKLFVSVIEDISAISSFLDT